MDKKWTIGWIEKMHGWMDKNGWLDAWIEKIDGCLEGRITNMKKIDGWLDG